MHTLKIADNKTADVHELKTRLIGYSGRDFTVAIVLLTFVPKFIKIDENLTKLWQKQFCTVFGTWRIRYRSMSMVQISNGVSCNYIVVNDWRCPASAAVATADDDNQ